MLTIPTSFIEQYIRDVRNFIGSCCRLSNVGFGDNVDDETAWKLGAIGVASISDVMKTITEPSQMRQYYSDVEEFLCDTGFARSCEDCGLLITDGYLFADDNPTCVKCANDYAKMLYVNYDPDDCDYGTEMTLKVFGLLPSEEGELDDFDTYYTEWEGEF